MGRPVVLSNGQLFVGINEDGLVHDFYYPYVGLDNLTNARSLPHRIGVWVDNKFSWVDDGHWQISVDFEEKALISAITMHNEDLKVTIETEDFIDNEYNALIRRLRVKNHDNKAREIRLFMHQVFEISRSGRGDTALYVPDDHYLLDYKGRCCLIIAGKFSDGGDYDQYAVGGYGVDDKNGTYKDAEDGELSDNPVEHGGVDSVLRFARTLPAGDEYQVDYWVIAGDSQYDAQIVHTYLKHYDISNRQINVRGYWQKWLEPTEAKLAVMNKAHQTAIRKSLLVIKAHCDARGSILASGDSSIFNYGKDYYCYCWPRDGSYAVWPLIRFGLYEEAKNFFEFARDTVHREGYMMHKYQPDRAIGSTWHPLVHNRSKELAIQEDETASVIYMMGEYYRATNDIAFLESYYETFVSPCAYFLTHYVDRSTGLPHASYDLWEEKFLTTSYSTMVVIAALETAASLAEAANRPSDVSAWQQAADRIRSNINQLVHPDGYFRKGYIMEKDGSIAYDDAVDISSLYGTFMYSGLALDDERLNATAKAVQENIADVVPIGGVLRYPNDAYFRSKTKYGGNPWIVCTLWLAQYLIGIDKKEEAKKYIDWSLARQMSSGILSEQFDPENGDPLGVAPLVWSHAEVVNTLLDYYGL